MRLHVGEHFGRRFAQTVHGLLREAEIIFPDDFQSLLLRRGVGIGGAGGDHVQRVADDVGQNDRKNVRGAAMLCEAPALDGRKTLADGVHLHNVRAAGQQLARDLLLLGRLDQRQLEKRGAAAGDEKENRVVRAQSGGHFEDLLRGGKGILVRDRVPGLADAQRTDGAARVLVFGDDDAAADPLAERLIGGVRHLPRRLSDGHKADAAGERGVFQRAADRRVRLHGPEGAVQDRFRSFTKLLIHAVFLPTGRAGPLVFC